MARKDVRPSDRVVFFQGQSTRRRDRCLSKRQLMGVQGTLDEELKQ